jgi:uncharacterized membrane protein YagU involved in acid resistance
VNTAFLKAADQIGIVTARGGLLTLVNRAVDIPGRALATNWQFQQAFHVCVGIGMAVFYALIVRDPRNRVVEKSLLYAMLVWLANALVVLPLIGQGFAGTRVLSIIGIAYFALAHTTFFVLNGLLLARFSED